MPNVSFAIEVGPERIAAARWSRTGSLDGYAVESLPVGALVPSAVETNIVNSAAVKAAVGNACDRLRSRDEDVAMILPDTVIRVFVQHFEEFPRSAEEAVPMLRWKLKKSVPFEADETLISYMRQAPREAGVDIVTALARLRIIRAYDANLTPQMLLEEIFPVAAYYQDTWQESIKSVRLAGLGTRLPEFVRPLEDEFRCDVRSLLHSAVSDGRIKEDARPLADRELEGLIGWMLQRG